MLDSGYLGQLIAGVFYLIVGFALFRLSRRSGGTPERYLSFYFIFTGVDYFSYSVAAVFELASVAQYDFVARVAYAIAVVFLVMFIRDVFRPGQVWATWLAASCSLGLIVPIIGTSLQGNIAGVVVNEFWYWPNFIGYTVALMWLTFEAFHAHAGAKKRLRIGLCDRAVVNRYLLWGCFGAFQVLACAAIVISALDALANNAVSGWSDYLMSGTELASIGMVWLAFFPPAVYLTWVAGAKVDAPVEG